MLQNLKSQRGGALLIIVILTMLIASIYMMSTIIGKSQKKNMVTVRNDMIEKTKSCEVAMRQIFNAIEEDKQNTGAYTYHLDYDFLEKYKRLDRFVFNMELWTNESGNTVSLDTIFGTEFTLIGECKDGKNYTYNSRDKVLESLRRQPDPSSQEE